MALCRICKKDKIKIPEQKGLRYAYRDDSGKLWLGRVCPGCVKDYFKVKRGYNPENKKCSECQNEFKPKQAKQTVCSPECRNKRKSNLVLKRRKMPQETPH